MGKIIKLTESDLIRLVNKILIEATTPLKNTDLNPKGLKMGDGRAFDPSHPKYNDVAELQQKLINLGFLRTKTGKPTGYFGKYTNAALLKALGKSVDKTKTPVDPNKENKKTDDTTKVINTPKNVQLTKDITPKFVNKLQPSRISATDSVAIFKAGQPECAQFVNDFSTKIGYVGNAWLAHDLDRVGKRVWSAFTNLSSNEVNKIKDLWLKIHNTNDPEKGKNYNESAKSLIQKIISSKGSFKNLKLNDVVGIYNPGSSHHQEAFYVSGKPYFLKNNGKKATDAAPKEPVKVGNTLLSGKGWGMNTHVGIVGAIKNGVPIIFHNMFGQVYADPIDNIHGGGKIAWVKRT